MRVRGPQGPEKGSFGLVLPSQPNPYPKTLPTLCPPHLLFCVPQRDRDGQSRAGHPSGSTGHSSAHSPKMLGGLTFVEELEGMPIHPEEGRAPTGAPQAPSAGALGPTPPAPEVAQPRELGRYPPRTCSTADCPPLPAGLAPCLDTPNSRPYPRPSEQPLATSGVTPSPPSTAPPWPGTGFHAR